MGHLTQKKSFATLKVAPSINFKTRRTKMSQIQNTKSNRQLVAELRDHYKTMPWWMIEEISSLNPYEYRDWLDTTEPELNYNLWRWNLHKPIGDQPPAILSKTDQAIWQYQRDNITAICIFEMAYHPDDVPF